MEVQNTNTTEPVRPQREQCLLTLEECGVPISSSEVPIEVTVDRIGASIVAHVTRKHTWIVEGGALGTVTLTGVYGDDGECELPASVPKWLESALGQLGIEEVRV